MPQSAEPKSIAVCVGRVTMISAPHEHAPHSLDWSRWVNNTALLCERFETLSPRRILLLDKQERHVEVVGPAESEFSRQPLQTVDLFSILQDRNQLTLSFGSWTYGLSSWVESIKLIATAKHSDSLTPLLDKQFSHWKRLAGKHKDSSLFVLADVGTKFVNAHDVCFAWMNRIVRSRLVQEVKQGAWSASLMRLHSELDGQGERLRLHRLVTLPPTDWCGDPEWQERLVVALLPGLEKIEEVWISLPHAGLILDVYARLRSIGLKASVEVVAPSAVVGWHPLRDFVLFLGAGKPRRLFAFLDSTERLQFIVAEAAEGHPHDDE